VRSPTPRSSVVGEKPVDEALHLMRHCGTGRLGNFYWLPQGNGHANPLQSEVHIFIIADRNRVCFTRPNGEGDIRYVLSRVRALCTGAP
jgi:hypothetical protein